jgi:hypothetical protein
MMATSSGILERRTFRILPEEDMGFAKPALSFERADGSTGVKVAHDAKAPEPEIARRAGDPGYWTITIWLPVGAKPLALIPDPDGPQL